jgi:hypothetical protein
MTAKPEPARSVLCHEGDVARCGCALLAPMPAALAASSMLRWVKTARRWLLGAFYDKEVHRYVDVEPERGEVLYHFAIGHPVAGPRLKR